MPSICFLSSSHSRGFSVRKPRFLFPPPLSVTISDCLCCFASLSNRAALQSRSSTNSQTWKHTQIHHSDTFVCLKGTRANAVVIVSCALQEWKIPAFSYRAQTSFSLLIYTSRPSSVSVLIRSRLTLPTLSSVVSYSVHALILLLHPHILQTPAKFWLYSGS